VPGAILCMVSLASSPRAIFLWPSFLAYFGSLLMVRFALGCGEQSESSQVLLPSGRYDGVCELTVGSVKFSKGRLGGLRSAGWISVKFLVSLVNENMRDILVYESGAGVRWWNMNQRWTSRDFEAHSR